MDDDLKLVERVAKLRAFLDGRGSLEGHHYTERPASMPTHWWREHLTALDEAAATITRLHAEITQMTNTIDGLEFQRNEAWSEIERLKSDVSDLVRAGSDEATENERLVKERDEARADSLVILARAGNEQLRAETAESQRDAALEALRPFKAAFEHGVTELPDDIQAVQIMRSRVGFAHFRAASRTLEGGEG